MVFSKGNSETGEAKRVTIHRKYRELFCDKIDALKFECPELKQRLLEAMSEISEKEADAALKTLIREINQKLEHSIV